MVPNGWNFKTLDELAIVERGKFSARPRNDPRYYGGSIPFVQTGDIASSKTYLTDYSQTLNEEGLKVSKLFPKNTILITIAANIGDTAITSFDVACPDSLVAIQPVAEKADTYWLKKILETRKTELDGQATQNAQKNINLQVLKPLNILTPPIEEQRKIAKILSTWDKAISTTERLIDNSKKQKKALMQQLLTGKKRLLDDSGKPFEAEWEDRKLEDISSLMTDYVANGSFQSLRENVNVTESKNYALYVRLVDLRAGLGHSEQKYVDKESFDFLKKSCLHGGELLMANIGANVGEVWQMPNVDLPATLAPNMLMTKFKSYIDSGYVYYFLASDFGQNRISKVIAGSGHPKINKTELKQVKVLLPPLNEQQKITKVLINADKEIELLEQQLADLKQEKKALMQQLLTGKRRVKVDDKEVA